MTDTLPRGMRAVLADTGPLIAAMSPRDQYRVQARAETERLRAERRLVVVPFPILFECHALALRRHGPRPAHVWLGEVRRTAHLFTPEAEDFAEALRRRALLWDQPITLYDTLLAVLGDRLALPVWTYDHHFDLMGVAVWR